MRLIKTISIFGYISCVAALVINFYFDLSKYQMIDKSIISSIGIVLSIISFVGVSLYIGADYYRIFLSNQRGKCWLDAGYTEFIYVVSTISFWASLTILFYVVDI